MRTSSSQYCSTASRPYSRQRPSPIALAMLRLVDILPALDAVGATGIRQALARLLADLVRVVRQQDVAGRQIGGVKVVDVHGKAPAELQEARHFGPQAVADDQRIGSDIERRRRSKLAAPESDGVDVPEILVQHIRHHAEHVRQIAVVDLIFEIDNGDRAKTVFDPGPSSRRSCLAPIRRSSAG